MAKKDYFLRYLLIIKKLRNGDANLKQLTEHVSKHSDSNHSVSERTIQRDISDIRELFNIDIECSRKRKVYHISYAGTDKDKEHMLNAFDMFHALNFTEDNSKYIQFDRKPLNGSQYFSDILQAIKQQKIIKFNYYKFEREKVVDRTIQPFLLKQFKNRWYLFGNDVNDNFLKCFALDRFKDLETTSLIFEKTKDFNPEKYFENVFGIIADNEKQPETIVLSFTPYQGNYVKSFPLHHSQKVLIDNEIEFRIQLKVKITYDFILEILSHGSQIRVLQPKSLKEEMLNLHTVMAGVYSKSVKKLNSYS